ncbi:ADP-ribosylation factor-like protein 2 isoform 3-T3 [Thomomys bottae]
MCRPIGTENGVPGLQDTAAGRGLRDHGASDHSEEDEAEGAGAETAHARPGQCWQDHHPQEVQRGRCGYHLSDLRLQHQNPGASRRLAGATLLIFANKQDLPGALSSNAIQEALDLDSIRTHHWRVQSCSAFSGEDLLPGIDWLLDDISSRIFTAD